MGDFNIDILKESVESEDFLNNFFSYGYEPYFNSATRSVIGQNDSCIDNAFIKSELNIESYTLNYRITDHYCLLLKINNEKIKTKNETEKNRINNKRLNELSNKYDWEQVSCYTNMDQATEWLIESIKKLTCESKNDVPKKGKQKNHG